MVNDGITKVGSYKSKVFSCGVCGLRIRTISVLCVQCGKWMCSNEEGNPEAC